MYEDLSSAEFYLNELAPLQDGTKAEEEESIGFFIHIELTKEKRYHSEPSYFMEALDILSINFFFKYYGVMSNCFPKIDRFPLRNQNQKYTESSIYSLLIFSVTIILFNYIQTSFEWLIIFTSIKMTGCTFSNYPNWLQWTSGF